MWGMLKSHQLGVVTQYCKTLLQILLGIYFERFYQIPLFTILLLFYVFEVGKAKSATQSILMILTLKGLFRKRFYGFYFTLGNFRQNKASPLDSPQNRVTPFRNFKA